MLKAFKVIERLQFLVNDTNAPLSISQMDGQFLINQNNLHKVLVQFLQWTDELNALFPLANLIKRIKEASYLPVVRSLKIDNLNSYHAHLLDQPNYWSIGPFLTCPLYMRRRRFWYFCRLSRESIKGGKEVEKGRVTDGSN
ncbi:hypothetical protein T05_7780 [Trichinella murrelli]|uniref:Uncharacterized protein n=1 Tax=Trichinella murrelli TaxID=144512 RepID=A0A0V0TYJ6_9BILA|nr:hypothetical protein T05_7780 [Trichinella murrelli]